MKFLAMLKDSLREAIDSKVFYVMVGLSLFLTLLAFSVGFTPAPGARQVVEEYATLPLNNDAADLERAQTMQQLFRRRPVQFSVDSVEPLDGETDGPDGRYRVKLTARFNTAEGAEKAEKNPEELQSFVRQRFGLIEGARMMEASEIQLLGWEGFKLPVANLNLGGRSCRMEVLTSPTAATARFWPTKITLLFGAMPLWPGSPPLYRELYVLENVIVGFFGSTIAVLVSIVITAFFIPNMLRKGSVDLLLVKPISRPVLLLYKFVGGLTFIFLNTAVAVIGIWLALGVRSGVWAMSFLISIFVLTFFFAILYSASTFFGVITRSPIASILLTCATWFLLFIVGLLHNTVFETLRAVSKTAQALHEKLGDEGMKALSGGDDKDEPGRPRGGPRPEDLRFEENWFSRSIAVMHAVLPRTNDLSDLTSRRLRHDLAFGEFTQSDTENVPTAELPGGISLPQPESKPPPFFEVLGVSSAFIAVLLGLSCWRFSVKDY
jgi:ABC-type transport system involved in multi-copper enzyme maturation permease subunit